MGAITAACVVSCLRPEVPCEPAVVEHVRCQATDQLCLVFRNDMSPEFQVRRLLVVLDGSPVFDDKRELSRSEHVIYAGAAEPGEHLVQTLLQMKTKRGYYFEARSSQKFGLAAGSLGPERWITVAYEKPLEHIEERPAIRYIDQPALPPQRPMTIWVSSKSGDIALDGRPSDLDAVARALDSLAKDRGVVVYGVDAAESPPHPNAKKVTELIARSGAPVRLSTLRDFSDVIAADGKIKK